MEIPQTTRADWGHAGRGRFASLIRTDDPAGCAIGLLGVPDDTGVGMNNGRLGAAQGPSAFRAALARYGAAEAHGIAWPGVFDAGDVALEATLGETHERVTAAAGSLIDAGLLPVMIGGGHDLTFPFVRAVCGRADGPVDGVYFDAHLDVREETGSGMPFRRLIEDCGVRSLAVHGFDPMANSSAHTQWYLGHGGQIASVGAEESQIAFPDGDVFVSFDLDVIDQGYGPGVSAMNPCGWSPAMACRWVRAAGACDRVRCFDIMELSPPHDDPVGVGGRTARLAARLFLEFLAGYSERES